MMRLSPASHHRLLLVLFIGALVGATAAPLRAGELPPSPDRFLRQIRAPRDLPVIAGARPVVVAVVDDGIRLSHRGLRDFIWENPREVAGNGCDDDGNGFIDDSRGWDVADFNDRVSPPPPRAGEFYHGTHLAGIIARIVREAFGSRAPDLVRIMPVKALPDQAAQMYLKTGYQGVAYAAENGADIILCAWDVTTLSAAESKILQEARNRGALVVASAGNFSAGNQRYPAAHDTVLAVAAIDPNGKKADFSNYGGFVDLSAPGVAIASADSASDDGTVVHEGTSQAAAMAAAAAALVKVQHPDYGPEQVIACLKNGADALDVLNPDYASHLGAGLLNVQGALSSRLFEEPTGPELTLYNPQGYLRRFKPETSFSLWHIRPYGEFSGFRFRLVRLNGDPGRDRVWLSADAGKTSEQKIGPLALTELSEPLFVPGRAATVRVGSEGGGSASEYLLAYETEPIDFKTRSCRDTVALTGEGELADGSGGRPYEARSDCKWLISAPPGKVIRFTFSEFDTQANTDLLYFFNGSGTHEKIMAVFSGQDLPPELTTWSNEALVWFVTDDRVQGQGWQARYRFVERGE